jgi:opacity protein-like surface antigen
MDNMSLAYPSLQVPHILTTPRGTNTNLAYHFRAGVQRMLSDSMALDVEYRYSDYGEAYTAGGDASRYRPGIPETTLILIGGTRAKLKSHGFTVSFRYLF